MKAVKTVVQQIELSYCEMKCHMLHYFIYFVCVSECTLLEINKIHVDRGFCVEAKFVQ